MNMLVVDWDYFFRVPHEDAIEWITFFDWGHSEARSDDFSDILWATRARTFLMNDRPLPMVSGWETFAERFDLHEDVQLIYGNSNVMAAADAWGDIYRPDEFGQIWLYDAHHDSGYGQSREDRITCEDWLAYFTRAGTSTHVRYPPWHRTWKQVEPKADVPPATRGLDKGNDRTPTFDVVYVCRSDAWVPPWCDDEFHRFLATWPVDEMFCNDDQFRDRRPFSIEDARDDAKNVAEFLTQQRATGFVAGSEA